MRMPIYFYCFISDIYEFFFLLFIKIHLFKKNIFKILTNRLNKLTLMTFSLVRRIKYEYSFRSKRIHKYKD